MFWSILNTFFRTLIFKACFLKPRFSCIMNGIKFVGTRVLPGPLIARSSLAGTRVRQEDLWGRSAGDELCR